MSDETKESMSEVDNVDENDDDGDKDEPSPPRKRARRHRTAPRITCNELKERIIKAESLLKNVYRVSIPPRVKGGFKRKVFLEARKQHLKKANIAISSHSSRMEKKNRLCGFFTILSNI